MLGDDIAGRQYIKSHHNAALGTEIGRSHGSIELKHQNISAVLDELGLPWIFGYKPMRNYQIALFAAIDRFLSNHKDVTSGYIPRPALRLREPAPTIFSAAPTHEESTVRPRELERLIRKFDPVERDFRNRQLGRAGEEFVLEIECKRLVAEERSDLAKRIRWVSDEDGDGAGFDILSFDRSGAEKLIEVKTTNGAARTPFFLTRTEHGVAQERIDSWELYRVHHFAQNPQIFTVKPPLEKVFRLDPESWRATLIQQRE